MKESKASDSPRSRKKRKRGALPEGGDDDDVSVSPLDGTDSSANLVSCHRRVIDTLLMRETSCDGATPEKCRRLAQLKRQRMALAAELAVARDTARLSTVGQRLLLQQRRDKFIESIKKKNKTTVVSSRPYLQNDADPKDKSNFEAYSIENASVERVVQERDLAIRMQQARHKRKIAAAYRLAGISISPGVASQEVLALRFDIEVEGQYVACYHLFFELGIAVYETETSRKQQKKRGRRTKGGTNGSQCKEARAQDNEEQLYLRRIQHTLPSSIPLSAILKETMGANVLVGQFNDERSWDISSLRTKLRECSQRVYRACHCYELRKRWYQRLLAAAKAKPQGKNHENGGECENHYRLEAVDSTSDGYSSISFRLMKTPTDGLQVTLDYSDPLIVPPTQVQVVRMTTSKPSPKKRGRRRTSYVAAEISDDDEDATGEQDIAKTLAALFRRVPILTDAVEQATTLLADSSAVMSP